MIARALLLMTILSLAGAEGAQQVKLDPSRVAAMHDAFRAVDVVQAAVVRGDLDGVRAPARELAGFVVPPGLPDVATKYALAMSAAARQALQATDITSVAIATSDMLATCGGCHRGVGTMPATVASKLPSLGGTVGHMLEHKYAADQMLRGLVVPSTTEWQQGARALRVAPLRKQELPRNPQVPAELLRVEESVHRLADDGARVEGAPDRARVYGTLLAKCAECHRVNRLWGPGR
jgi:cytochrome c553